MNHVSIDGFAGGGGASEGLRMAGVEVSIAINHDPAAIRIFFKCTGINVKGEDNA